MEEQPVRKDTKIAIIVVIAGLLTGAVLTWAFVQSEDREQPRDMPEYRVADSQRIPFGSDEEGLQSVDESSEAPEDREGVADAASAAEDGPEVTDEERRAVSGETTASERKTMEEARQRMRSRGVEEYVDLTEELFVRVSAKMVIMASVLSESAGEDVNPAEIQGLLADNAAEVLAKERVNPEEFWSYTSSVHSDPERAMEIGEKILREAEKHTGHTIRFDDVPGMEPTPVPGAE